MKPFQPLISAVLASAILFSACTSESSKQDAGTTTDTTQSITENAADDNQQKLEANKTLVKDFYQSLYGDKDTTAIDKYVADDIKQHNPILEDGKEWLKTELRPFVVNPNIQKTKVDIRNIVAEGDMVWLYVKDTAPNGKVFARVNIFKVENGKITEAWKVSELVPEKGVDRAF